MTTTTQSAIYRSGALYDLIFPGAPDSGLFLAAQAQKIGGPILELACGTGVMTLPLARRGYAVTGLDISAEMLEHAQRKSTQQEEGDASPVEWVQADMRDFDLNRQFNFIFLLHNSASHLHTLSDFHACMTCVRRHLAPGGLFIVNTFMPDLNLLQRTRGTRHPFGRYRDPDTRRDVGLLQENDYDPVNQINRARIFRQFPGRAAEPLGDLLLRIFFPQEFDGLLQWNGFTITRKLGNYQGAAFGAGPGAALQTQLCICTVTGSP